MGSQKYLGSVIAVGNPFDGMAFYGDDDGLFASTDDASTVAETWFRDQDWWIIQVYFGPENPRPSEV